MGMFDWKVAPGGKVISDRFWIYWAFTAPITVLLLICFFTFVWVRQRPKDREDNNLPDAWRDTADKLGPETPFETLKRRHTMRHSKKQAQGHSESSKLRMRRFWEKKGQDEGMVLP